MKWIHKASEAEVKALGGFPVLYCDPPWAYRNDGARGSAAGHYHTEKIEDLYKLPVADLAAPDCALFMWGTYPLLPDMLALMGAWGFSYKTIAFQWVKTYPSGKPFFGLGSWTRGNTEGCFLGVRGKPKRVDAGVSQLLIDTNLIEPLVCAEVGRHSAKPAEIREKITRLMGDVPAIELFARDAAPGWECWGNEVASTVELQP